MLIGFGTLFSCCILFGLIFVFGLFFYYDRMDKKKYESLNNKVLFHCIQCSANYLGDKEQDKVPCPNCGCENIKLKF